MKIELYPETLLAVVLILLCGFLLIYLDRPTRQMENFPANMKYTERLRQEPKRIIPHIMTVMKENATETQKSTQSLPDDFMYLYDYEKNFDTTRVYGDYTNKKDAYSNYLLKNKNKFHNLSEKDIDNLTKLLNNQKLSDFDIPESFEYNQEFQAMNH